MGWEPCLSDLQPYGTKAMLDALIKLDRIHSIVRFRKDGFHHIISIPEESYQNVESEEDYD